MATLSNSTEIDDLHAYFRCVHKNLQENLEADVQKNVKVDDESTVLFRISPYNCILTTNSTTASLADWLDGEQSPDDFIKKAQCTIVSTASTFTSIAKGKLNPMTAFLQGNVKFTGDRKILRWMGPVLKDAAAHMNSLQKPINRYVVALTNGSNSSDDDITTRASMQSVLSSSDNVKSTAYNYYFDIKDQQTEKSWIISKRFSDFVTLHKSLAKQGHIVPHLRTRTRLIQSQASLIKERKSFLADWLNQTLTIVGDKNPVLCTFFNVVHENDVLEDSKAFLESRESMSAVWQHAWSKVITWNKSITSHSNSVLQELWKLKSRLSSVENGINSSFSYQNGGILLKFEQFSLLLITIFLTMRLAFILLCKPNKLVSEGRVMWVVSMVMNGITWLLFTTPQTRFRAMTCLVAILALYSIGSTTVNVFVVKKLIHHLASSLSTNDSNMLVHQSIDFSAVATAIWSDFSVLVSSLFDRIVVLHGNRMLDVGLNNVMMMIANIESVLFILLLLPLTILLQMPTYNRAIQIYSLGFALIFLYIMVKIFVVVFRLSQTAQEATLYEAIDGIVAPYIAYQIAQFRSIFVKFAQYFSARADVVTGIWADVLSNLQDNCPPSSRDYVVKMIEKELNDIFIKDPIADDKKKSKNNNRIKISDIFLDFKLDPVAAASIGQVHFAKLDLENLEHIRFKSEFLVSEMMSGSLSELIIQSREALGMTRTSPTFSLFHNDSGNQSSDGEIVDVVVKIQHENIASIMMNDMHVTKVLTRFAAFFDKRWEPMHSLLESWEKTLVDELDFHCEGSNLREMHGIMTQEAKLGCVTPFPIPGLIFKRVMVMTTLFGYKITDKVALSLLEIDRGALLHRIAHAVAYQLLVAGLFNADPHPGNVLFCLIHRSSCPNPLLLSSQDEQQVNNSSAKSSSSSSIVGSKTASDPWEEFTIAPGLLDFGMTVRMKSERRKLYCQLLLSLFEGDMTQAAAILRQLGYQTNQSNRAPERDAEFFEYIFRDASQRRKAQQEGNDYTKHRETQREEDEKLGVREKGGRSIDKLPEDFLFLTRVVGLLRGLTAELDAECPILQILALHAKAGLQTA